MEIAAQSASGQPLTDWEILGEMPRCCEGPEILPCNITCRLVDWKVSPRLKFFFNVLPASFGASLGSAHIRKVQEELGKKGDEHNLVELIRGSYEPVSNGALPLSLERNFRATLLCQKSDKARVCDIRKQYVQATHPMEDGVEGLQVTLTASLKFTYIPHTTRHSTERRLTSCFITDSRMHNTIRFSKEVVISPYQQA